MIMVVTSHIDYPVGTVRTVYKKDGFEKTEANGRIVGTATKEEYFQCCRELIQHAFDIDPEVGPYFYKVAVD